jgi:hypothetical protein
MLYPEEGAAQRDQMWQRAAQENSAFGDQIRGVREAMKVVEETKKAYPEPISTAMLLPFRAVEDHVARDFLGDVLFSRMISSPGYLDYGLKHVDEAQSMASELGLQEGWQSEQAKGITLKQSIGKVLQGDVRIVH